MIAFLPLHPPTPELELGCVQAGITIIPPPVSDGALIELMKATSLLLTEDLRGAVIAVTLGVPFISIYATRGHEVEWRQWCASMEMIWNPIDMEAFTLSWARDFAVPQRVAPSVLAKHKARLGLPA